MWNHLQRICTNTLCSNGSELEWVSGQVLELWENCKHHKDKFSSYKISFWEPFYGETSNETNIFFRNMEHKGQTQILKNVIFVINSGHIWKNSWS